MIVLHQKSPYGQSRFVCFPQYHMSYFDEPEADDVVTPEADKPAEGETPAA